MLKMIALLSTCLLWTTPTLAQYAEAIVHVRTLFDGTWDSTRLESICNPSWGTVQFRFCSSQSNCKWVSPDSLHYSDLDKIQEPMLLALSEVRKNLVLKARYHSSLFYGPNKNDVLALDQVIAEIKSEGLKKWVLLKNDRKISPNFSSYEAADEISATMMAVLNKPIEPLPATPAKTGDEMATLSSK